MSAATTKGHSDTSAAARRARPTNGLEGSQEGLELRPPSPFRGASAGFRWESPQALESDLKSHVGGNDGRDGLATKARNFS
jgi:hypothetical protein